MTTEAWLQALTAGIVDVGGLGEIETFNFKSSATAHSDMVQFSRSFWFWEFQSGLHNALRLGRPDSLGRVVRLLSVPGTAFRVLTHCFLITYLLTYLLHGAESFLIS